eukprot:6174085-Pleurochrysis_carterae.AAC.1
MILEARQEEGKWKYVTLWSGYDTPIVEPEEIFMGKLRTSKVYSRRHNEGRYGKDMRRAANHSGERRSRVTRTAAADDINVLSSHQVERDRPLKRRPLTARVVATIKGQERI